MAIVRDETTSLVEAGVLYDTEAMQGQETLLIFDFDVVADEELTLSSESDPNHFSFTVQKMTVINGTRIYASILVTKAQPNTVVIVQLQSNLFTVATKNILIKPTAPAKFTITYSEEQSGLVI